MSRITSLTGMMAIGLWASAAGAATNVPAIPNFNVQATCNELQKVPEALSVDSGQPDAIRHCLDHEQQARDQLSREWNKFKTADRNLCVGESHLGPSPQPTANWKVASK